AKQVEQVGRRHAGRLGDFLDLRLAPPVAADMRDGAPHDAVVGGGSGKRGEVGNAIGRQHGFLPERAQGCHVHALQLGSGGLTSRPISAYKELRIGPRLAAPRAAASAVAKSSLSAGLSALPTASLRPRLTRNRRSTPYSGWISWSSLVQTGLSVHSLAIPRALTLRSVSSLGVTVTCS